MATADEIRAQLVPLPPPSLNAVPVLAPLAPSQDTTSDQIASFYRPTAIPVVRHSPLPVAALSATGAATKSTAQTTSGKEAYSASVNLNQIPFSTRNQGAIPPLQKLISNLSAISFQGAWSSTITYSQGASVDYLGNIYVSLINNNIGNTPSSSPTDWSIGGTPTFLGAWSSSTTYTTGQTVTVSTSLYIALQTSTNQNPASTTGFWQLLSTAVAFYGAWNSSTAYPVGAAVTYQGNTYIATTASTNQTPSSSSSFWQLAGPGTLDNLVDGTSRFGQTASGLSYRPLSNPLTAHDAGANVTINIAAFTMRTSSKGDISDGSGSITALSYSTVYYVYYDDPTLAGGGVSYNATTTKEVAINGAGRFYVGSILTPIAGAPDTSGFGDGGVGAQNGAATIYLGSLTSTVIGSGGSVTSPNNAIDGNLTTFSAVKDSLSSAGTASTSLTVKQFSPFQVLTVATLFIRSQVIVSGGTPTATLAYSLDGVNFTNIYSVSTNRGLTTDSVAVPLFQNLGLIQVRATAQTQNSGGTTSTEVDVYEAWIEVTT